MTDIYTIHSVRGRVYVFLSFYHVFTLQVFIGHMYNQSKYNVQHMYKYSTLSIGERQLFSIGIAKHGHIKIKNILIQGKSTKI